MTDPTLNNMKNIILSFLCILLSLSYVNGQSSNLQEDSILYITPADEAFMIDKESTSLLKVSSPFNSLVNVGSQQALIVAFEQKISTALSVIPSVDINFIQFENFKISSIRLGAELRYYYRMKNLIQNKKQANNLSSNYFAVSYGNGISVNNSTPFWNSSLTYGIQKRFLNYGYLDYRLSLSRTEYDLLGAAFYSISSGFNVGLGFGKNYNLEEDAKCPIFKCYTNRTSAIKINLNNSSGITMANNLRGEGASYSFFLRPNFIYEHKIANSPLSIENDLNVNINFGNYYFGNTYNIWYDLTNRIGLKYYVNQRKNIRNGKSGNNLSGQYIFARSSIQYGKFATTIFIDFETTTISEMRSGYSWQAGYGIQKEVLKNFFFDINLGISKPTKVIYTNETKKIKLVSDIKVGLMF